jgi:hypothetical protein
MPLTHLSFWRCLPVPDLAPLRGMSLRSLSFEECNHIKDLGPLKGMPLERLVICDTGVTDLRPLQGMSLKEIWVSPKNVTQGLDILRHMKSLKTISSDRLQASPAAEFWARYDKGEFK